MCLRVLCFRFFVYLFVRYFAAVLALLQPPQLAVPASPAEALHSRGVAESAPRVQTLPPQPFRPHNAPLMSAGF